MPRWPRGEDGANRIGVFVLSEKLTMMFAFTPHIGCCKYYSANKDFWDFQEFCGSKCYINNIVWILLGMFSSREPSNIVNGYVLKAQSCR